MEALVHVAGLSFSYHPGSPVMSDVAFSLHAGEVVGILGPNGSGKTTLLEIISGKLKPEIGTVRVLGDDPSALLPLERARRIAYLVQRSETPDFSTVEDIVISGRRPYRAVFGFSGEDRMRTAEAMERLGIHSWADRPARELSGGEFQRVLLARTLAQGAPIVLCDEPAASLDIKYQKEIFDLLRVIARERGNGVLVSLHDLTQAAHACDSILLLAFGGLLYDGPPEGLEGGMLSDVFGIRIHIEETARGRVFVY